MPEQVDQYQNFMFSLSSHTLSEQHQRDKDLVQGLVESNVSPNMLSSEKVRAFNKMISTLELMCEDELDMLEESIDTTGNPAPNQTASNSPSDEVRVTVQNGTDYFNWMADTIVGMEDE